jgi:hypothetical protein
MSAIRKLAAATLISATLPFTALVPAFAQDAGDPPDSVARIAEVAGTVSFHPAGSQEWQAAAQNYPVTAGSGVWSEPRAHASVDINGARIHLDGASDLEITSVDPQAVQLSVPQGAVFVHVYPGATGQTYEIDTPRGAARIAQPGQYEIEAGDDQHPMTLSVYQGAAQLVGQSANLTVQPGQRGVINPDNSSSTAAAQPDDFVRMVQTEEQAYQNTQQTAQYVSPAETGYQDLARYGQWQQAPQYGAVWYPQQVAADWAPYRDGHWAYVAPWGWTWVDDAPWGFTPFHYGRWVQVGGRWGWTPGERVERPVYAPALVSFFGNIGGVGIDLSVGWVPLAPEEVYVPPYRHSPRYVHDINIVNVHNETKIVNIVNNVTVINYNNYANRRAATVVDRQTMAGSRSVATAFRKQPNNDQRWAHAQAVQQVAVQPQAKARPGDAPKFDQHQTSNAQFAAQTRQNNQGKAKSWNGNAQVAAQPQVNGKPQTDQGKSKNNNGQFAAQPQQQNGQRPKNAAPGPVIVPQANGTANASSKPKPQFQQGQANVQNPNAENQTSKKTKNAAPGPVILPQNTNGAQPQWKNQQNGQAASQQQSQSKQQKSWKNGQAPTPTTASGGVPAVPSWKQNQGKTATSPAVIPNQLPASIQNNAAPSQQNDQKHKQKNTTRSTQQAPQPAVQQPPLVPQVNQPAAQPSQKASKASQQQNGQPQNGGQQSQSKHSKKHNQQAPQGQPQNQSCNPQGGACTQ